ncbi:CAP domain-containing protein [Desulfolithobacter sp.]
MYNLLACLLIFLGLAACQATPPLVQRRAPLPAPAPSSQTTERWSRLEQEILILINGQRLMHQLLPLRPDPRLYRAALLHSREMTHLRRLTHQSRDGLDFSDRIKEQGYHWTRAGENVALEKTADPLAYLPARVMFGTDDLTLIQSYCHQHGLPVPGGWQDVGRGWSGADWDRWKQVHGGNGGWMGSRGHRRNILLPGFTDTGIGHSGARDRDGSLYHYFTQDFAAGDSLP